MTPNSRFACFPHLNPRERLLIIMTDILRESSAMLELRTTPLVVPPQLPPARLLADGEVQSLSRRKGRICASHALGDGNRHPRRRSHFLPEIYKYVFQSVNSASRYFDQSNNRWFRPLLRLHRKHTRGRKGYARNGRQGQEGRATLRQITTLRIPPRRCCPQLAIHRSLCPCYPMVQYGQP